MHEAGSSPSEGETDSALPDVNGVPLDTLLAGEDSALHTALRRLLREMERPGENYAAHGSTP